MGKALLHLPRHKRVILLLALWLLLTPLVGLALNTWGVPFYHVRYAIAVLPAVALLVAYGIRQVWWRPIAMLLLLWFVYVSLSAYQQLWPAKTSWDLNIIRQAIETRRPGEPSLVMIARDYSVEAYVDRQLSIRNSDTLDPSERRYSPAEIKALVGSLDTAPAVCLGL